MRYNINEHWLKTGEGEMTSVARPETKPQTERQSRPVPSGKVGDLLKKAEQILRSENTEAAVALAGSIAAFHQEVSNADIGLVEPDELRLIETYRKAKKLNATAAQAIIDFASFTVFHSTTDLRASKTGDDVA